MWTSWAIRYISLGQKKVVLFPQVSRMNFFYHLPARISRMCMRTYIFCFKKRHKQTNKIPLANLFIQFYGFLLQTTKDRALCFSTKKSPVRVVF